MNLEAELAQLLIRMGSQRGVDVETILAEMSWAQFPSFVDASLVRESLLDSVESWWRADLEDRISQLRNQFAAKAAGQFSASAGQAVESVPEPIVNTIPMVEPEIETSAGAAPVPAPLSPDMTIQEAAGDSSMQQDSDQAFPRDATMIWTTRG